MNSFELFQGLKKAPQCLKSTKDDVVSNFLDLASICVAGDDIFIVAAAAFTEVKPYIGLTVKASDPNTSEALDNDFSEANDATALRHTSRFKNIGKTYAGQKLCVELEAIWLDEDGNKNIIGNVYQHDVENFSALEKLDVTAPRASDGKLTRIQYYHYYPADRYDYNYPENRRSAGMVKAMLPLKGQLEFGKEWHPVEIDYGEANAPKLFMLLPNGGALAYAKPFAPLFTLGANNVAFNMPDDELGVSIDITRLSGSSTYFDLFFSFSVKLKNEYYPTENYTARATVLCKPLINNDDPMVKVAIIEPLNVYWDCLWGEMLVTMANGSAQKLSTLVNGGLVLGGDGKPYAVKSCTACGMADMLKITTTQGTAIGITPQHTVQTNIGFVQGANLTSCGYLLSRCGTQNATAVEDIASIEQTAAEVYAVELEGGGSLICNGIIVGDAKQGAVKNSIWPPEIMKTRAEMSSILKARAKE